MTIYQTRLLLIAMQIVILIYQLHCAGQMIKGTASVHEKIFAVLGAVPAFILAAICVNL